MKNEISILIDDPYAHVCGFRWNSDDYENGTPSGEDMFRAVASGSKDLLLFTQFTGPMGSTVDGIGYFDPEGEHLSDHLEFDFLNACKDDKISFDYFTPNSAMNKTKAPGIYIIVIPGHESRKIILAK